MTSQCLYARTTGADPQVQRVRKVVGHKTPHIKATCCAQYATCKRQSRRTWNIKTFYLFLCLDALNFMCVYLFVRRSYKNRYPDNIFWNGDKILHVLWNTVGHVYYRTLCHNPENKSVIHDSYKNLKSYIFSPLFSMTKINIIWKWTTKCTSLFTIYFNNTFLTNRFQLRLWPSLGWGY